MQIGNGVRYFERFSWVGLVCKPNSHDVGQLGYKYRAVLIYLFGEDYDSYRALIFSSETQKWSKSVVKIPQPPPEVWFSFVHPWNNGGVVGCDGVLYWLSDVAPTFIRCAIIALNPFKGTGYENQRRFIDPPADLYPLLKINLTSWGSTFKWSVNLFLGACQSRLRLACLPVKGSDGIEVLRVWEMKDYNDNGTSTYSWHVVHEVCIEGKDIKYILGFDASNGNVIFVYINGHVSRYNIVEDEMQNLGKFPIPLWHYPLINAVVNAFNVFHPAHPSWPTPVPLPLPSIS